MTSEPIWTIDAHNRTATEAIIEFCATHWQEQRRCGKCEAQGDGSVRFSLRDGVRQYVCKLQQGRPNMWAIRVAE